MIALVAGLILAQAIPDETFVDPEGVSGEGLALFSDALGNTFRWQDTAQTRFGGSR